MTSPPYSLDEARTLLPDARRRIAEATAHPGRWATRRPAVWRDDEDAIAFYHGPDGGYATREPVAMLDRV